MDQSIFYPTNQRAPSTPDPLADPLVGYKYPVNSFPDHQPPERQRQSRKKTKKGNHHPTKLPKSSLTHSSTKINYEKEKLWDTLKQKFKSPHVAKQSLRSIVWTTSYGHYKCLFIYF